MLDTISRKAKSVVYTWLNSDPGLLALLPGGILPSSTPDPMEVRLDIGPHIVYFVGGFYRERMRFYKVQVVLYLVVPDNLYNVDGVQLDKEEYAEVVLDRISEVLERKPGNADLTQAYMARRLVVRPNTLWEITLEVPVTKANS